MAGAGAAGAVTVSAPPLLAALALVACLAPVLIVDEVRPLATVERVDGLRTRGADVNVIERLLARHERAEQRSARRLS